MTRQGMALVLGATGGIGGEAAATLVRHGWRVRTLVRRPATPLPFEAEVVVGDAMNPQDLLGAARGAELIVHAVNPPGYKNWRGLALPMLDNTIAAARRSGARILFPGTIYNYGPDAGDVLRETSPQHPTTRKGQIRVEMEARLQAAAADGVPVLLVRAGDYFGPHVRNSWFAQAMVKPERPLTHLTYPGPLTAGHAFAYLPDLAEAMVRLLHATAGLPGFHPFHFRGHWFETGHALADAVRRAAGRPELPVRRFPWALAWAASPFVTVMRELLELRYLWRRSIQLDNSALVEALGSEPHTPADQALRATLRGLGCLPRPDVDAEPEFAAPREGLARP